MLLVYDDCANYIGLSLANNVSVDGEYSNEGAFVH